MRRAAGGRSSASPAATRRCGRSVASRSATREFELALERLVAYLGGGPVRLERGASAKLAWIEGSARPAVPVHVAASGARTIAAGARHAQAVDFTVGAETGRLRWAVETARAVEREDRPSPRRLCQRRGRPRSGPRPGSGPRQHLDAHPVRRRGRVDHRSVDGDAGRDRTPRRRLRRVTPRQRSRRRGAGVQRRVHRSLRRLRAGRGGGRTPRRAPGGRPRSRRGRPRFARRRPRRPGRIRRTVRRRGPARTSSPPRSVAERVVDVVGFAPVLAACSRSQRTAPRSRRLLCRGSRPALRGLRSFRGDFRLLGQALGLTLFGRGHLALPVPS